MSSDCNRCLLYEAGESVTYDMIMDYIKTLDKNDLVDDKMYEKRLSFCKNCDFLISGMCRKCGCYVEVRARLKNSSCPNFDNKQW